MEVEKHQWKRELESTEIGDMKLAHWLCLSLLRRIRDTMWLGWGGMHLADLLCGRSPSWWSGMRVCGSLAGGTWGGCYVLTSQWTRKQRNTGCRTATNPNAYLLESHFFQLPAHPLPPPQPKVLWCPKTAPESGGLNVQMHEAVEGIPHSKHCRLWKGLFYTSDKSATRHSNFKGREY